MTTENKTTPITGHTASFDQSVRLMVWDQIIFVDNASTILSLSGIPSDGQVKSPVSGMAVSSYAWPRYVRPVKPDEVVIYVWTKDGKRWRAVWEEVK